MGKCKQKTSAAKAGLKKKTQNVKSRVKAKPQKVLKAPAKANSSAFGWKQIFILGEQIHTDNIANLYRGLGSGGEWDFDHLEPAVVSMLEEHPGSDVYLFGGSPQLNNYDLVGHVPTPIVNTILVRQGHHPPELVAIRDYQRGGETIVSFREVKLSWQRVNSVPAFQKRVFALQCMQRSCAMKNKEENDLLRYEYASLYTQRPSIDWKLDRHGKLEVPHAMFTYKTPDKELIDEEFDKEDDRLETFVPDFLERYDLDESHAEGVKEAIRQAFDRARSEKVNKMILFNSYDKDVLENIKVIKFYPRNSVVEDHFKTAYVNEYYGRASLVV